MEYIYVNLINLFAISAKYALSIGLDNADSRFTVRSMAIVLVLANSLLFPLVYRYAIKGNPRIFLFSVYSFLSGIAVLLLL